MNKSINKQYKKQRNQILTIMLVAVVVLVGSVFYLTSKAGRILDAYCEGSPDTTICKMNRVLEDGKTEKE